jgi:archaellum component FlaF (FlaF/FlaG flagellin family)
MPVQSRTVTNVSANGQLIIEIEQTSQSQSAGTSHVTVRGKLRNNASTGSPSSGHPVGNVTCSISGDGSFTGTPFDFSVSAQVEHTFLDQSFTITHTSDGTKTVHFTVSYGVTGNAMFPSNQHVDGALTLTRIPVPPAPPTGITFTNQLPTSVTVSWTASADNGGSTVVENILKIYQGTSASGPFASNSSPNLTRNITGLIPGQSYTFTVTAQNNSAQNNGLSNPSTSATMAPPGGCYVRVSGVWKAAIPYIRVNGKWIAAAPSVRAGGKWKITQ